MKIFSTLLFVLTASIASAQWSNTNNLFYDSLHTPVCNAVKSQQHPLVVQSFPDSGYFVIWEDARNDPSDFKTAVYVQKYDKLGAALWVNNGIPVSNSNNRQHYSFPSGLDYRNHTYAATDSTGGFYITYADDSVSGSTLERVCVQHVLSNGGLVFPGKGAILATSVNGNFNMTPQLIPDNNKGFFVAYRSMPTLVYAYCYRDEGGSLHNYGGGLMNENALEVIGPTPCGNHSHVNYPDVYVDEYSIFSDLQGGCNIAMYLNGNGTQGKVFAYNKLFRAKKNAAATQYHLDENYNAVPVTTNYQASNVYKLWFVFTDYQTFTCGTDPIYVVTQTRLLQNGYQVIDGNAAVYDYSYVKGATVTTNGNINVSFFAADKRVFNPSLSNPWVQAFTLQEEKYDSIPYQRASDNDGNIGYNTVAPPMDKLNFFRDTLLVQATYPYDFSLAGGANQLFAAGVMLEPNATNFNQSVRLQHLAVERQSADSFAVVYKTAKKSGEFIAKDFGDSYTPQYDFPVVSVNKNGTGFLNVRDYFLGVARISPIFKGAELAWGAMGRSVGTGVYNNNAYYNSYQAQIAFDPGNSKGMIAWNDSRDVPSSTAPNIYMRHLDSLFAPNYYPPYKRVRIMSNPYTATLSTKFSMYGVSKRYSLLEAYCGYGSDPGVSPVAEIKDNYYFGAITARVFQTLSTRTYNGKAFLNRNFTIYADSVPPGASINLRLFFTKIEFDALKAADNSLSSPADLVVIKQPNNSSTYPTEYLPVAGEQTLIPIAWDSVPGGYYIEVKSPALGDFFIQKSNFNQLCPGGSTFIVSSLTGTSYQWQVNTGSGFVNLANNANYSGVTTATLQLNNVPSAWAAYQYRCVVDGTNSAVTLLRFTTSWSGSVNTDWGNAANWSCGTVPDANTDVVLNAGTVVVNVTAACRTLTINPAVSFTVAPGISLTVVR